MGSSPSRKVSKYLRASSTPDNRAESSIPAISSLAWIEIVLMAAMRRCKRSKLCALNHSLLTVFPLSTHSLAYTADLLRRTRAELFISPLVRQWEPLGNSWVRPIELSRCERGLARLCDRAG